ncbi:MAG: NADH-quinone oxidoreductase subunit J [Alphaproteobacteria bacterium]|nr:NADH-quinone oxidoreductase subunit J [Alphaproteobacteria bacterium]
MTSEVFSGPATGGGFLLVLAICLPTAGMLLSLALGGRLAVRAALVLLPVGLGVAIAIAAWMWRTREPLVYYIGGWAPPLGLALRADGLSAAMLATTAIVICATGLYGRAAFRMPAGASEGRAPLVFWVLLMAIWAAMNLVFLGDDLFNLYVALELLTFAAVPLVCLDGRAETLAAALRYLLFALLGSVLYLLGTALLYGGYGSLDIALLFGLVRAEPVAFIAVGLMTAGLLAKTALFPLHLWLPPAHAGAPPAASAMLSGLVVKASFFLVIRLWFDVMPGLLNLVAAQVLSSLGAGAIVVGSVLALRQPRLKLLIAYSTIAQIGYLFLMFPLAAGSASGPLVSNVALTGGMLQAISHAFAKAAMFMSAGLIAEALGHDRIAGLRGVGQMRPITVFAFGVAALSLVGLPLSGGFVAKWLLLTAAMTAGQWWWALVMVLGGLLAGGYMFRVLAPALADADQPLVPRTPVARSRELIVLALALCSVLLGLLPLRPLGLLQIGRPNVSGASSR